jgi:hypothetical protein
MAPGKEPQLAKVLPGNNPSPTSKTGWSKLSGREFDLLSFDYGQDGWSIACNQTLIGPGTIGWIYRSDGSFGHLAGLIMFECRPKGHKEPGGTVPLLRRHALAASAGVVGRRRPHCRARVANWQGAVRWISTSLPQR